MVKLLGENIGSKAADITLSNCFSDMSLPTRATKEKKMQMGLHQTENVLHSEGNHQENEKTIY